MPELPDTMYCSEQICIPPMFPYLLRQYAKSAIRTQPTDLLKWSTAYFRCLSLNIPPPVKPRLEYPIPRDYCGVSPGWLKSLVYQLSGTQKVHFKIIWDRWTGSCLSHHTLIEILCLAGFDDALAVPWLRFIAMCAGHLTDDLTHTMILICETLTEEPEGGSAMISYETFIDLYTFLARIDASKAQILKNRYFLDSLLDLWREKQEKMQALIEEQAESVDEAASSSLEMQSSEGTIQEEAVKEDAREVISCPSIPDQTLAAYYYLEDGKDDEEAFEGELRDMTEDDEVLEEDREHKLKFAETEEMTVEVDGEKYPVMGGDEDDEYEGDGRHDEPEGSHPRSVQIEEPTDAKHAEEGEEKSEEKHEAEKREEEKTGEEKPEEGKSEGEKPEETDAKTEETGEKGATAETEMQTGEGDKEPATTADGETAGTDDASMPTEAQAPSAEIPDELRSKTSDEDLPEEKEEQTDEMFHDEQTLKEDLERLKHFQEEMAGETDEEMEKFKSELIAEMPLTKSIESAIEHYRERPKSEAEIEKTAEEEEKMDKEMPEEKGSEEAEEDEFEDVPVPAVPGIGGVVPEELIEAVCEYMKKMAKIQHGMVMPRNIRHFSCPPLEVLKY